MAQDTPIAVRTSSAKRTYTAMAGRNDPGSEDENAAAASLPLALALPNPNVVAALRHYGTKKRLCPEQLIELENTLKDLAPLREAKAMANMFALTNLLEEIVASKPAFELSADLEVLFFALFCLDSLLIHDYRLTFQNMPPAILLSEKLNTYKGEGPKTILLEVIKRFRFGIPDRLEQVPADWAKVVSYCEYVLTQRRLKTKKTIKASLGPTTDPKTKVVTYAPNSQHQNIFDLTTAVVKGTSCSVSVALCSHVALMRKVYLKYPNTNFWDQLDVKLEEIRTTADGDPHKVIRAFRHALERDQEKHGKKTYKDTDIQERVDDFQQKVDDIISIGAMNAATPSQEVATTGADEA
ncbi:hypothetical protein B0H14DRAFT_3467391 [Mycena olivaceomarginata]|nr:hypothetical protein B0H14DRAFT_3467391 [Mycena olivaceomarginata]